MTGSSDAPVPLPKLAISKPTIGLSNAFGHCSTVAVQPPVPQSVFAGDGRSAKQDPCGGGDGGRYHLMATVPRMVVLDAVAKRSGADMFGLSVRFATLSDVKDLLEECSRRQNVLDGCVLRCLRHCDNGTWWCEHYVLPTDRSRRLLQPRAVGVHPAEWSREHHMIS